MGLGSDHYFATGVDESPLVLVASGPIGLASYSLYNNDSAQAFLQFFDAASIGAVTLGGTTPDYVLGMAATTSIQGEFFRPLMFTNGIVIGFATTATGNGATGSTCEVSLGLARP